MRSNLRIIIILSFLISLFGCQSTPEKLLMEARRGNLSGIRRIINTDANIRKDHLTSILPLASAMNRKDIMELLIRSGADVNAGEEVQMGEYRYNGNALFIATVNGKVDVVQLLLKAGANPRIRGSLWQLSSNTWENLATNVTPLYIAASRNFKEIIRILLRKHSETVNVDSDDNYRMEALLVAARLRQTGVVDLLIKAGVDVQKAYEELRKNVEDHDAKEVLEDRSRRVLLTLSSYHSLIDQCDTKHAEAKEVQKKHLYNRINRKLRSLFYRCSKRTIRSLCRKMLQKVPYRERKLLLKQCAENTKKCCGNCRSLEDFDTSYRCYSTQSFIGQQN